MDAVVNVLIIICDVIFPVLFLYQAVYLVVALLHKEKEYVAKEECKYAFLIAAKNEEKVIPHLINSMNALNYPRDKYEIFLVADNCTDATAQAGRDAGAIVFERTNDQYKGKGYALDFLLGKIKENYGFDAFDGYLIFDADNLLDENYLTEMNKLFSNGHRIITSYRNSKNYGSNWISAASGMWFLREARHLNRARMALNVSCMASGTGYVIHKDIIKKYDGWKFFRLTEDVEFSVNNILAGEKVAYCEGAIFYDEQPVRFIDSWNQRLRWTKGFYQIFFTYGGKIFKRMITKHDFACYDILMIISPGVLFLFVALANVILMLLKSNFVLLEFGLLLVQAIGTGILSTAILFLFLGILVILTEGDRIYCSNAKKWGYVLLFPIFMLSYVPLAVIALFIKVKWTPIRHDEALSNEDMGKLKDAKQ